MTAKRALVVGIDAYGAQYPLDGCVNDARAMADVLQQKFDFPSDNITLLTDAAATKDAILGALDDLVDATNRGDVALFYYAGHGSRLDAKVAKASGFATALCPVDVTTGGGNPYFLLDDELHERLLDLAERTSYITVIVDACHSGTVTRDLFGDKVRSMSAGTDSADAYGSHTVPRRRPPRSAGPGGKGPSGWVSLSDNYVLIAGCRDEEVSNEFTSESGEKHGVLTYFLTQELTRATSGTTYRDVFERAAASVTAHKPGQHPQMEGRVDRDIFGVRELLPMNFASVVERNGDRVVVNRGSAHGVTTGSTYHVYSQGTKRVPSAADPANLARLGAIEIESVSVVRSVARITAEAPPDAVAPRTRAFEISHARGAMAMSVDIVGAGQGSESTVAALRDALSSSPLVDVSAAASAAAPFARAYLIAPRASVGPTDPAPQLGAVDRPTWAVVDTTGQLLMPRRYPGEESIIRGNLEKVVRYRQALALENPNPNSALRGKFAIEVMRWDASGQWVVATPDERRGLPVLENGEPIAFRVTSTHDAPAYISVLDFQENHALSLLFPTDGGQDMFHPGSPFEKGAVPPGSRERMKVQGEFRDGALEVTEALKLFVTSSPANFGVLAQTGTRAVPSTRAADSPVTTLLRIAVATDDRSGATLTRAIVADDLPEDDPDDWTAVTASFVIRRTPVAIDGEEKPIDGRTTLRANGFAAVVSNSAGSNAAADEVVDAIQRALGETDGVATKRIEVADARRTEGTRDGAGPSLDLTVPRGDSGEQMIVSTDADGVVTLHFPQPDGATRALGGPAAPLKFRIPVPTVGEAPAPGTRGAIDAAMAFSQSQIGRQVLTLIVYPMGGAALASVGEDMTQRWETAARPYRARAFSPDNYARGDVPSLDVEGWRHLSGGRSLLFLHDTFGRAHGGFAAMPRDFVAELDRLYEGRVFAFDHFTLSHDPRRNAATLLDLLTRTSDASLDVDVLAHGRGALVARALVEGGSSTLAGIDRVRVRNVVMAGAPNAGTPFGDLVNIERAITAYTVLASSILTQFGGPIAGGVFAVAKAILFKSAARLEGISAMRPGSNFLDSLKSGNAAAKEGVAPRYFALASDFLPQEPGVARRLRNLLADKMIPGAHDLIVSTRSALDSSSKFPVRDSLMFTQTDGVAHSHYLANRLARGKVLEWLRAGQQAT